MHQQVKIGLLSFNSNLVYNSVPAETDALDLHAIAKQFVSIDSRRVKYFGTYLKKCIAISVLKTTHQCIFL